MKPQIDTLVSRCPAIDRALIEQHISRLGDDYFERFSFEQVVEHLEALGALSKDQPVRALMTQADDGRVWVTVLGFDLPFVFSVITGLMAGTGFSIESGDVFTYGKAHISEAERAAAKARFQRARSFGGIKIKSKSPADPLKQRRIIDHFEGKLETGSDFETWSKRFSEVLSEMFALLVQSSDETGQRVKERVAELVTARLTRLRASHGLALPLPEVGIDNDLPDATRLSIRSKDTPAFLYSLSTALSLIGLSIERVRIRSEDSQVEDDLYVVDSNGKPITDPEEQQRIRFTAVLTKQFTYHLDRAPDPFTALTRFEQLAYEVLNQPADALAPWHTLAENPQALEYLARLLGASDYLWEEFIRFQYASLAPIFAHRGKDEPFCDPDETVNARLEDAITGSVGLAEQQDALNRFKDRELFMIELDHILRPSSDFKVLSQRLTHLAVELVGKSAQLVYDDLVRSHGRPMIQKTKQPSHYAVFGLGKLGGNALGYASDLELLYVYPDAGKSEGGKRGSIANSEFYEMLVREVNKFIKTKHEGIYTMDLRLRPFGKDGPLASTKAQFEEYYSKDGGAHSFERLALLRLRYCAGNPTLGEQIEALRDSLVYESNLINEDELWDIWRQQHEQKLVSGIRNAKYGPGALVDLESASQLLQARFGATHANLRTPRLSKALHALADASAVTADQRDELVDAYYFFRRLINALRMLRGSAIDLNLPPVDSGDFLHLARRMEYPDDGMFSASELLDIDFDVNCALVRRFIEEQFGRHRLFKPEAISATDALLANDLADEQRIEPLAALGFAQPQQLIQLVRVFAPKRGRTIFAHVVAIAARLIAGVDNPDVAIKRWHDLMVACEHPRKHAEMIIQFPQVLRAMLHIFSQDDDLAEAMIASPESVNWVTQWSLEHHEPSSDAMQSALRRKLLRERV